MGVDSGNVVRKYEKWCLSKKIFLDKKADYSKHCKLKTDK